MSRMTLSDRIAIEAGIYSRKNLTEIAKTIHKYYTVFTMQTLLD